MGHELNGWNSWNVSKRRTCQRTCPPSLQAASVWGGRAQRKRRIIMHLLSHVARPCPGTVLCATFWVIDWVIEWRVACCTVFTLHDPGFELPQLTMPSCSAVSQGCSFLAYAKADLRHAHSKSAGIAAANPTTAAHSTVDLSDPTRAIVAEMNGPCDLQHALMHAASSAWGERL